MDRTDPHDPHLPRHPVLACLDRIDDALTDVADIDPTFMRTNDKAEALLHVARLETQLAGLKMRLMVACDDVAAADGARDAAAWLAHRVRTEQGTQRADLDLAKALDRSCARVAEAIAHGSVNTEQARVIVRALDELPGDLDRELLAKAEAHLVAEAAHFAPKRLRIIGRRLLEVIAPDLADAEEGKLLEAEERRALERASLRAKRLGDGRTRVTITVPDATATRLSTYLEAFASPRHGDRPGEGDRIPHHRKLGQAFCGFLEAVDPQRLPLHGGDATTVLVTVTLESLQTRLAAAGIGDTDRISASEARRLACTAQVVPVVLGGKSEILDLGRSRRLFTPAQRKAMRIRDRRCRAEGCDVPAAWCEAHHLHPWSLGGRTDLDDGILLCNFHHRRAHDDRYQQRRLAHGDVRFTRRT